jgi:hypothetical protein
METLLKCPFCETVMNKVERGDVIIDRCPNCLGIWLDKGELDKIVQRRKEKYQEQEKRNWGKPNIGSIPPSGTDDIGILVDDWE